MSCFGLETSSAAAVAGEDDGAAVGELVGRVTGWREEEEVVVDVGLTPNLRARVSMASPASSLQQSLFR